MCHFSVGASAVSRHKETCSLDASKNRRHNRQPTAPILISPSICRWDVSLKCSIVTSMRIGEAAGLHVDDLDFDNGVIYVPSLWVEWPGTRSQDRAFRSRD
jgi:integrase